VSRLKREEKDLSVIWISKSGRDQSVKTDEISRVIPIRQILVSWEKNGGDSNDRKNLPCEWLQWFDTQFPLPGYSLFTLQHYSERLNVASGLPCFKSAGIMVHFVSRMCVRNIWDGRSNSPCLKVVIVGGAGFVKEYL
jgi:hypothetical protein